MVKQIPTFTPYSVTRDTFKPGDSFDVKFGYTRDHIGHFILHSTKKVKAKLIRRTSTNKGGGSVIQREDTLGD